MLTPGGDFFFLLIYFCHTLLSDLYFCAFVDCGQVSKHFEIIRCFKGESAHLSPSARFMIGYTSHSAGRMFVFARNTQSNIVEFPRRRPEEKIALKTPHMAEAIRDKRGRVGRGKSA